MLKPDPGVVALSSRRAIEAHVHRRQPDLFDLLPIVWDRHAEFCACFGASGRWLSDASYRKKTRQRTIARRMKPGLLRRSRAWPGH